MTLRSGRFRPVFPKGASDQKSPESTPQALADFSDKSSYRDEPEADTQDWFDSAMRFLRTAENDEQSQGASSDKKCFRLKSFDMCVAWDNILRVTTGVGLKHYVDPRFSGLVLKVFQPCWPPAECPSDVDWVWLAQDRASTNLTPVC